MFQPRDQLDWTKAKTQTEHMEGNTVIWKAILWILVIHCQDTRKQAVAGTQARDSYPSHIIENADCHFYPWSSCMWSYQQVELPEKKRWSAGLEGNFLLEDLGDHSRLQLDMRQLFSTESSHWKVLPSFCFLLPALPGMASWMRSMWSWQIFFPDTLPGTNYSNYSPWKSMVGRWHFLLGPALFLGALFGC